MNIRIFSLVCILFYVFMAVSIYCSEQKHDQSKKSGLRSKIIRAFKKTKRNNKKNDIESQREIQSNNNNNANVSDSDDEDNFKYRNRKKYEEVDNCCTYCCGLLCGDDDYVPDSFYSHSVRE
ncbi:fam-c protein [Plasmodium vinckei petteri]|uniref:Fam-c protein n=1 Tax=Plasmodium vinckei petteri TaxID=138298 RepID=A0A6V7SE64_PLAVN|nr:fam-c protein [Plasmodium vinckei petteri]